MLSTLSNYNYDSQYCVKHITNASTYINIPDNVTINNPIVIMYTANPEPKSICFTPHNHIILGKNSKAQIIEIYLNQKAIPFVTNAQTLVEVQDNANLTYTMLQQANIEDQQKLTLQIIQQTNSQVHGQIFSYGGKTNQVALNTLLTGKYANCDFKALEYSKQTEKLALNIQVEHRNIDSVSNVFIRSILDDQSTCSVYGKVLVPPNITNIKAELQHKTILLSEQAKIETQPQLEVYNDNVTCSHGASIGKLDEDALIYMYTRGISILEAKQLLLQSFIAPIIDTIPCINTRQHVKQLFCPEVSL